MSKYELYVAAGPLEGQRIKLDSQATLIIGRTPRGLNLPDPQVSPKHAEISWSGDRFWIVDLDSATGTVVNGRRVGREPLALHPGMRVEIGESILVLKLRQTLPTWMLWFLGLFVAVFLPLSLISLYQLYQGYSKQEPALDFTHQDLKLHTVCGDLDRLYIDQCFMQETGQNQALYWKKLRDLDDDGYEEIWLEHQDGERIYTFDKPCDERGQPTWYLLAKLPKECIAQDASGLSDLQCPGRTLYGYVPKQPRMETQESCSQWSPKGRYTVKGQTGVTAWMPNSATGEQSGGPFPYQFTFHKSENLLGGFLEARGIDEPIHFLICEDFLPGVAPQVMTQSGEIKTLQWGCIRELSMGGTMRDRWFGSELPKAVAFTSIGREKLIEHSAIFLSGTPDASFMNHGQRQLWDAIRQPPESRSSVLLSFHSPDQGMFWGNALEVETLKVEGRLDRLKLAEQLPPIGKVWKGGEDNELRAPCGCSMLFVTAGESVVSSSFNREPYLTIVEGSNDCAGNTGAAKPPWTVPYETGQFSFSHANVELEVDLKMSTGDQIEQVVSMSIAYRTPYPCRRNEEQDFPVQQNMFDVQP